MSAATILRVAADAGITVRLDGDHLVLSAPAPPGKAVVELLRREKASILDYIRGLASWTDEDWQALFYERAGIMEYDGGLTRADAEVRAADEVTRLRSATE